MSNKRNSYNDKKSSYDKKEYNKMYSEYLKANGLKQCSLFVTDEEKDFLKILLAEIREDQEFKFDSFREYQKHQLENE